MAQGRRVRRVVRRIDTWSVLKVSGLFFFTLTVVLVLACILLWAAGSMLGAVGGVEKFMQAIGFEDFRFVGPQLLRGFVAAGLVIVVLGTGFSVLFAVVYNLISDLVGGIQLTVLEEDTRARPVAPPRGADGAAGGDAAGARGDLARTMANGHRLGRPDPAAPDVEAPPPPAVDPARAS